MSPYRVEYDSGPAGMEGMKPSRTSGRTKAIASIRWPEIDLGVASDVLLKHVQLLTPSNVNPYQSRGTRSSRGNSSKASQPMRHMRPRGISRIGQRFPPDSK